MSKPEPKPQSIVIHGETFGIVLDAAGIEHVKIADLCWPFDLDVSSQRARMKSTGWATQVKITSRRSDGKQAPFLCLPLDQVPMYFATLSPGHVAVKFRPALVAMQKEVARAVGDYFLRGGAIRPTALPHQLEELKTRIDEILREVPLTEPIWPAKFVKRYEAWNDRVWNVGDRQPFSMRNANGFFYEMIFPREVLAVIKARGLEDGVRYHQVLADVPRDYLGRQLDIASALADDCGSEGEWRTRMRRVYNKTRAQIGGQGSLDL